MFRTKEDVKRHVQEIFRKVKNENERHRRCYNVAQQFYKVRDYESAKHYLSLYLSVKEDSPLAHKLQGQIWEALGDKIQALNAYKTSLEYDPKQADILLKLCELLCETDVAMDPDRAQYWCERGSDIFPYDPIIFRLKEKLLKLGGKANNQAFEELINSELKARPNDVTVRTRLMRLYLDTGRTKAAYNHAVELETNQIYRKELAWYECFAEVCKAYADEFPSQVDWQTYCTWVSVLDKVCNLSMSEWSTPAKKIVDCVQAVYNLDQVLFKAANTVIPKDHSELFKQFVIHMTAQLCFHIATLILKRAKKESSNWKEAIQSVSPVLFLALTEPMKTESSWSVKLASNLKNSLTLWASDGYYRVSQAGYVLLGLAKNAGNQFTDLVNQRMSNNWRERTFQRLFAVLNLRGGVSTSHFVNSELLATVSLRLPTHGSGFLCVQKLVPEYEKVREGLHHLVWLGLETMKYSNDKLPPTFHTHSFTRLKLTHDTAMTSPETLTVLDMDAFLYANTLCAASKLEEEQLKGFFSNDRPMTLPADITHLLCNQEHINWWESARQVNNQQFSNNINLVVQRQQLQRGLEVIRVEGNHGLDVQLIVKLARIFADRASIVAGKAVFRAALESRAAVYWNAALPILERIEMNQAVSISNSKMFEYHGKELKATDVRSLLEEGRYFIACQFMKSDQHERAIEAFKPLRSPYASFNQALIYKKLAAQVLEERPREEITSEMRSKHVILLSKARECLNLTKERIRIDQGHPLHLKLQKHTSEVDKALSCIEPDPDIDHNIFGTARSLDLTMPQLGISFLTNHLNQSDGDVNVSIPSVSSLGSPAAGGDAYAVPKVNGRSYRHSSTPRHHHSELKRNGELVDVGQLLQIQTLHDEMKKMQDKLDSIIENMNDLRRDVNKLKPPGADDLYLFGDDEEYPDDVLNSQYPTSFVPPYTAPPQPTPTFYPPPTRGVQGTSTVTYGAPTPAQPAPVIPLIPIRMPIDSALAGYQQPQNLAFYNQGTLPFTEPQHIPDFLRQAIPKPVIPPPPPVNVVITTSDTLPTGPPPVQPTLSVTIPPQHRLGGQPVTMSTPPHNFQIAMPASATTPNLEKSPIVVPDEVDSEDDNEIGYDPCPNFQPIIPLPNEVNVTTGEEDDDILFENRAKLFRYVDKEWKERGVGIVKILKNRGTDKVRLLMRRDQVHKVCANHLLKSDMELTMLKNSDRALIWVANDFAEEVVQLEKFCIKFKTPEEALKFKDVFNDCKMKYGQSPQKPTSQSEKCVTEMNQTEKNSPSLTENKQTDSVGKVNVGGFTFTSPPKLKELKDENAKPKDEVSKEVHSAPSPFAAFKFTSQKPANNETPLKANNPLMQSTKPLFAGLNNTQNKHTLFDIQSKDQPVFTPNDKVPSETLQKIVLKEPVLPSVQSQPAVQNINDKYNSKTDVSKELSELNTPQPTFNIKPQVPLFASSIKETPKSILKEPPPTTETNIAKPSSATKHVLFQDSPSQQTPTLAALLTSPKTEVLDFAALSKINENKTLGFDANKKSSGFVGAGSTVFGNSRERKESEGENAEEFVPSAEFKPVIPLPELVEVKTGEESEEILFNERAKLLRFDPDSKEWKERGLGQMKILKDPKTGITRFLMRREHVHKVCCNHRIIQSIELKSSSTSEKAWTWYAVDYSEGEMKNELFAIRFKTTDLAKSFKDTVDSVQKQLREDSTSKRSCPDSGEEMSSSSNLWKCQFCQLPNSVELYNCKGCSKPKSDITSLPKLSELFRPKAGSWECKACYTVNGMKDSSCVSCDSPKDKLKSPGPASPATVTSPVVAPATGLSLSEMFKPKAGSWECGGCLVRNEAEKTICPACATPKPGHENDVKEPQKSSGMTSSSSFSFGINSTSLDNKGTGFNFGIKPSTDISKSSFTFGTKSVETKSKSSGTEQSTLNAFTFKSESTENKEKTNVTPAVTGFTFDQSSTFKTPFNFTPKSQVTTLADSTSAGSDKSSTFDFGNRFKDYSLLGASTPPNSTVDTSSKFAFGQNEKFEFNFSGIKTQAPRSPGSKSPRSPANGQESDTEPEEEDDYEADHIVFQPVVPLPDKVPVTTGEEDEAVLYSHRAKLFRFAQGEWKERGVGDIKILRHHNTKKIRLLMRREPIMKICLNHFLTAELLFSLKDDKTWFWSAPDFAENQISNEQFCLRFKTAEIASEFKAAIDSAKGDLEGVKSESIATHSGGVTTLDSHEVEVVYEAQVSEELREAALKLMLPPNFYRFLNAPPCPGCVGCEPDPEDEETAQPVNSSTPIAKASTVSLTSTTTTVSQPFTFSLQTTSSTTVSQPSFTFSLNSLSSGHGSAEPKLSSVATTGVSQPFTFTVKTTTSSVGSTESKVSSVTSSSTPLFSTPSSASPVTPLFGASSQAVTSSSFFSGTPFFQSPATKPTFGTPVTSETLSSNTLPKTGPLLFGTSPATQSATTLSFGNSQVSTPFSGGSVFSQTTKESSPLNNTTPTNTQSPASVFGSPTVVNDSSKTSSFFSNLTSFQSPQTSVFGGSSPQANTTMFGTPIPKSDNSTSQTWYSNGDPTFLFKPTTSFSEIAASGKQPPFEADKTKSNFTWAGAGLPVFGGKTQPAKKEDDSGGESGGEEGDADTSHDPVFEPIVPLPDAIEVRTGEEDEDIVFCQRAKFYRYDTDTKEWKERGIGNMKILRHKKTKSIRLLLRREQVHKVVCNQLIMADMELQSLANSDKAFCWAAMNMAEEYSEPRLEKVAVRFKNADQAREFKINVEECIDVVKIRKENPISDILDTSSTSVEPSIIIEEEGTEESEGEVEEAEYGEEYEPFFKKRATLHVRGGNRNSWVKISQGELSINFQNDDASLIILFKKDDGNDMAIAVQSEPTMENLSDKEVLFYGQDYDGEMALSDMKEFKADFCTSQASSEFLAAMNEVMELSHLNNSDRDSEQED